MQKKQISFAQLFAETEQKQAFHLFHSEVKETYST